MTPPAKERLPRICQECGKSFALLACQLGRGRGKFCSRECARIAMQCGNPLHCDLCDSPFYKQKAEQDSEQHFCSRACYMEWRAINRGDTYPKAGANHKHRIVAAESLGRKLKPGEVVHHIDDDKAHCDPSNLAVFPNQSFHARCHFGSMSNEELAGFSLKFGAPSLHRFYKEQGAEHARPRTAD